MSSFLWRSSQDRERFELNPANEIIYSPCRSGNKYHPLLGYSALQTLGLVDVKENDIFIQANLTGGLIFYRHPWMEVGIESYTAREIGFKKVEYSLLWRSNIGLVSAMTGFYALSIKVFNPNFFLISGFLAYSALKEKRTASYIFIRDITFKRDMLSSEGLLVTKELVVLYDLSLKAVINSFVPHRYHFVKVVDHSLRVWGYLDETEY